eukprot:581817-Alexandrium_andersonii.AAC.1
MLPLEPPSACHAVAPLAFAADTLTKRADWQAASNTSGSVSWTGLPAVLPSRRETSVARSLRHSSPGFPLRFRSL